jgi:hypothetical protein
VLDIARLGVFTGGIAPNLWHKDAWQSAYVLILHTGTDSSHITLNYQVLSIFDHRVQKG